MVLCFAGQSLFAFEPMASQGFAVKIFQKFRVQLDEQMAMLMLPPCILLTNTDLNTNLTGWTTTGTVTSITDAYAGARAVELTSSWATMTQVRTGVTAGRVYTLSVFGKRESTPSWAVVKLEFLNSSNAVLSETVMSVGTTVYTEHRESSTAPTGTNSVRVTIEKSGSGKLKLDEFCLEEYTPAIGECTLVENPGFETGRVGWDNWNTTVTNVADANTGSSAAQLSSTEGSLYRRVGITPGETYELTAWSKLSGSVSWAQIYLSWKDASNNTITDAVQPVSGNSYALYSIKGKAPANAVYAEIGAYKSSGGLQFVDDFCFKRINPLGGTSFDLGCGCSDNMVGNGGFEANNVTSFPYTLDGKPAAAIPNGNSSSLYPWSAGISSAYLFLVNDATNTVNNPEGNYYVWLANSGDCWTSNSDFSNNLLLEDGETYSFCFYAASRSLGLNSSGLPNGNIPAQNSGNLALEFQFVSGFKVVNAWSVPASESATNLSWTKFEYTFTYNILDPISNFTFTNARSNVGMYIDAVSLSKVNCPAAANCNTGGLVFDRWGGISGVLVDNLISNANYPNNYNETGFITSFQSPQNYSDNYGTRVYGYIVPPTTGNYVFNVTGDDNVQLFLSTDQNRLNKRLIADVPGWSNVTEYTKFPSQTSANIGLTAGQNYYVELLHKEGSGGDHFQVYWKKPGDSNWSIVPSSALRPICSQEVCDNGRDDDFDGLIDCADPDCSNGMSGSFTVVDEGCGVANGSITMTPTGGDTPYSYRWSDMVETAWWTFENNTNDVSGNNYHENGIIGYPIYTSDCVQGNKSLYFNGNTAIRYSIDGGFMEVAMNNLTVAMWIKPDDLSGTKVLFEEGGTNTSSGIGIAMQLSNNILQATIRRASSTSYSAGTRTIPNDGQWHHVAVVFAAGKIQLFLDGVAGTQTTSNFTNLSAHGNNGGLGGSHAGTVIATTNSYYKGKMDDVRYFFNTALPAEKIADLASRNGVRTNLTAGTYNVTVTSASGCSIAQSIQVVSSGNFTNAGTIVGAEVGCSGSFDPAMITSSATPGPGVGTIEYKWQSSTNGGSTWTDIANTNAPNYDPPAIAATTSYRRAARRLPCADWVFSNVVVKSFTANFTEGGTINDDETKCGGYDPEIIVGTKPEGGAQTTWKVDPPASGTKNGVTYTVTSQNGEPMFLTVNGPNVTQVTVKGGTPTAIYADPPFVNLTSPINPNNGTPYGISHFNIWIGGNVNGTTEYQWQKSEDDGATWVNIPSTNTKDYDPPFITLTTEYRRGARVAECASLPGGGWIYTNIVTKTVELNVTDPGIIVGDEENCGSFDPDVISSVTNPSGGAGGSLLYQWQFSTNGGTTWSDLSGATLATLNPITITTTTQYRRGARRSTCAGFVYSNAVVKMVVSNFTSAGAISGAESFCDPYNPANITSTSLPSGGKDGFTAYRWQQSTDMGNTWTDIAGATGVDYDPASTMTVTTWYRRQTRRTPCVAWINSNTIVKEVKQIPMSAIAFGPTLINGFICETGSYQFQAADAGAGATYSWSFGVYATPTTATGIGPHTVTFNVPNSPAFTNVPVQLTVTKNGCPGISTTNYAVRPPFTISSVSSVNPTSCTTPNGTLTVNASSPTGTSLQASLDGITWISAPLTFTGLGPGNYDVWVRYSGSECEVYWGDRIIQEPANPNPTFLSWSGTSACVGAIFTVQGSASTGSTVTWEFGTDAVPATASGLGPHSVYYTTGGIKTMRITATKNGCTGFVEKDFTVISNHTFGGTIGYDEALCANGVPTPMVTVVAPSGGYGGSTSYAWERNQLLGTVWSGWTTISSTNSATYAPGAISVTTMFRRRTRRGTCGDWIYSNEITKTVTQTPVPANDMFSNACPGFVFVGYVGTNDANLDAPIYSIVSQPSNGFLDLDTDGEFYYIPNTTFCGGDEFTYKVCNSSTGCCATATAHIDMSDAQPPLLNNIPGDLEVSCDDEIPLPPVVDAYENCGSVWLSFDQTATQGADSCSIFSYLLTRVWTASDYCGNSVIDQQQISIKDETAPDIYRIYTLPNGKRMIAGVMENVTQRWKTIKFPIQFSSPPVVLTQVVTKNDGAAVITRLRNVSTSQFQLRLQEEEGANGIHGKESVAWIAIEKGVSTTGLPFEVNSKLASNAPTLAAFAQSYSSPNFVGQIQTFNENNPATVRYNSLNSTGATIFCQEETSFDPEMNHGFETVGYMAFGGTGNIRNQAGEVFGEAGSLTIDHNFQTVNFAHRYNNPVVVLGGLAMTDGAPATIRVKNQTLTSFEVQIDEWDYLDGPHAPTVVSYIVVEGSIPFNQIVECSAVPTKPIIGVEIAAVDNCDNSTPLVISDSDWDFDCLSDTTLVRTFYVRDECGNFTELRQTFILRDQTPPTFNVPADITITCSDNKNDLQLTGDVVNEADNCATGLKATYQDNLSFQIGCGGYVLRLWTLVDHCGNTLTKNQTIYVTSGNDTDNDGVVDEFDLDSDNDGIPDLIEGYGDFDGDGVPNYRDLDCDNDGIPDIIEAGFIDRDGDGMVDNALQMGWDHDGDGYAYGYDANDYNASASASIIFVYAPLDRDGDGQPNYADRDSDNDGIPDLIEVGGADNEGNGIIDYPIPGDPTSMLDGDSDGFASVYDPDEDAVPGAENPSNPLITFNGTQYSSGDPSHNPDSDSDGIPDYLDLDSDNDGIPDLIEVGGVDENGDGRIDLLTEFEDAVKDGFHDNYVTRPRVRTEPDGNTLDGRAEDLDGNGSVFIIGDDDFDNIPNFRDLDADGDGIRDMAELRMHAYDQNGDGVLDLVVDNNLDGFHDGLAAVGFIRTDPDGPNNDGEPTDDNDSDTSPFITVIPDGTFGEANGEPDVDDDGDGVLNFRDLDSDDDGVRDNHEDRNRNGIVEVDEMNPLQVDTDGDGIPDGVEDANQNGFFDPMETSALLVDTDGDLLWDNIEDTNLDGIVNAGESNPRDACDPFVSSTCVGVAIQVRAKLQGPTVGAGNTDLMKDGLRAKGVIPTNEPYKSINLFHLANDGGSEACDPALLAVTGPNAVVDWVLIELRHGSKPDSIVATRSALLQRDGDVIMPNGDSIIVYPLVRTGEYYVALRHRNHLGVITEQKFELSRTPTMFDFTDPTLLTKGSGSRVDLGAGDMALWGGDFNNNRQTVYQGPGNDVLTLFFHIISHPNNTDVLANYISSGYLMTDFNLDGNSILQGPANDRSTMLLYATLNFVENTNNFANYVIGDKLPETSQPLAAPRCGNDPTAPACDFDGDGIINDLDLDDDDDGVYDVNDMNPYNPNSDSDADGIPDNIECGGDGRYNPGVDTNPLEQDTDGDGIKDGQEDLNKNGIVDGNESDPRNKCSPNATTPLCDFDGDGIVNAFDLDDDNDGVADVNDVNDFDPMSDSDADGVADGVETGMDGIYHADADSNPLNACDPNPTMGGCLPVDQDGDGYFANYPASHQLYDPSDVNPCLPNSSVSVCPCEDTDGDGKIIICSNPGTADQKTRTISLWLWPLYAAQGSVCGTCQY